MAQPIHASDPTGFAAVRYHQFGGPEVLAIERDTLPKVRDGQVLVEVAASSINAMDSRVELYR